MATDGLRLPPFCAAQIDVQGWELEVLRGLADALRERRVLYVLLEFWPKGMRRHAKADAAQVLALLASYGYALFDMHTLRLGRDGDTEPLTADATFHKPNELGKNAAWFHMQDRLHRSGFGYWTDMLAVATGELDFAKF